MVVFTVQKINLILEYDLKNINFIKIRILFNYEQLQLPLHKN